MSLSVEFFAAMVNRPSRYVTSGATDGRSFIETCGSGPGGSGGSTGAEWADARPDLRAAGCAGDWAAKTTWAGRRTQKINAIHVILPDIRSPKTEPLAT